EQVWPQAKNPRRVRLNQTHPTYAAMVEEMDTNIGRILKHLDATGLADNTVVVFTSDNGGLSTSEGLPTSNLPLRGGKGWIYEGGIRVPFIVRLPDGRFAGTVNSTPVTGMDLMPTLLDMAQVDNQPTMDGTSLTPLLDGAELQQRPLFWHYPHYSNQGGMPASAVRLGDYKLVQRLEDGRVHLYNLATDLEEQNDLAAQRPEKTQQLKQRLYNWYRDVDAQFLTPGADGATPWTPFQQTGDELQ
ncbi:MAG: sulfatase-like hydrolase/transferase, partial [Porticoccaceae bacterium]|nr:sulfatase-like hydrolase/transferase [Porticoccaceae bacterium]